MAKLGFKPGEALGKRHAPEDSESRDQNSEEGRVNHQRTEPLNLVFKENRGGIGLDSEKKRKIREEADEALKRVKHDEGDYRDRVRIERETRRTEGQVHGAQKVAERLDLEAEEKEDEGDSREKPDETTATPEKTKSEKKKVKPTSQINILYRGLVREREEKEQSIQARHALQTSLPSSFFPNPRLPTYDDSTLEREDKEALDPPQQRGEVLGHAGSILEQELEEEDPELDEFNALEPGERLNKLVMYLRERHWYCFWCKCRYETGEMEGCPGTTEEDHD